jgi:serine/threonine-protein kinase
MGTPLLRDGDRYELLGELASGGMATVYLARMRRPMGFSRLVAIKCMHPQYAKDPEFVSMFMDEARLTARLRHPNIVPTLDIVAEDGHLLLVMEYIEGTSLATLLRSVTKTGARVPVPIACAIVHDLLLGLHEAHQAKDDDDGTPLAIIHRDVSPQNVLVGLDGLSRVLDFGVAKARQNTHQSNDNEIKGKIPYMPPEQLFGEPLDHRVDVYAAGVTLWETLVGERLFDGPSEAALVKKISEDPIVRPSTRVADLPPEVEAIVMRALERDPKDRYDSALVMAEAIAAAVKLPTRTEVSAWVRQYVAPRDVLSGSKLPAVEEPTTRRSTMLAILERASRLSPSAKRPAALQPSAYTRARKTGAALVFATLALAVAGLAVSRVRSSEAAPPRVAPVAVAPTLQILETAPAAPLVAQPAPANPAVDAKPAAEAKEPETRVAANVVAPAKRSTTTAAVQKPSVARRAAADAEPAKKNPACAIPYTVDADGHKHFKAECF